MQRRMGGLIPMRSRQASPLMISVRAIGLLAGDGNYIDPNDWPMASGSQS
jgi:hypothetical protein